MAKGIPNSSQGVERRQMCSASHAQSRKSYRGPESEVQEPKVIPSFKERHRPSEVARIPVYEHLHRIEATAALWLES